MADHFTKAVEDGLKLSKRLYFGKDRTIAAPTPPISMDKSSTSHLPTAPMAYAVISDPRIVDNPDIASYQPHVHGRCDPPALIPLLMNAIELEVHCYLETAIIRVSGSWRVHCIMKSRRCDCRIAIPMGPQGSILGVEVSAPRNSYSTQLVDMEDNNYEENATEDEHGGLLVPNIFTLKIPEIDGGSNLSIKISWSQKILNSYGQFSLNVPFTFPDFVNPPWKIMSKREKIQIIVNSGTAHELLCKDTSHPLKEVSHHAGSMGFLYDSEVLSWSNIDFSFSYTISSRDIDGNVLWQSASEQDFDQREMFCIYLSPGNLQSRKAFRKDIIFLVDISGSMRGKLIDEIKHALSAALSKLNPDDSFNIIAFNEESYLFSTSTEFASKDTVEKAIEWINMNFVAGDGTNILQPLNKAIEMLSSAQSSVPIIFLVTDGTVEDERQICDMLKNNMLNGESICPRMYTFGVGTFCNHYFLKMLATIGRGQYDAALNLDLVEPQMLNLYDKASSLILANITIDFDDRDEVEVYPFCIPDLSSQASLMLYGRYKGSFPETLKAKGVLADFSNFVTDMKITKSKDIPLHRVSAKEQIEHLTAQAWLSENKQIEQKVAKLSLQTGFMSEYTRMIILEIENDQPKKVKESTGAKKVTKKKQTPQGTVAGADGQRQRVIIVRNLGIGFGNLSATEENTPPGEEESSLPEAAEMFVKSATNCCGNCCNSCCCCMCCIRACSRVNNQCATAFSQVCVGLGCFGCLACCSEICCCSHDS